jgi:transposase
MCSCGLITHAVHDDSIPKSIFGDGFVVLVGVLTGKYRLSRRNTVQFISELIGVSISLGMIIKLEKRLNSHLALVVDEVSKAMKEVPSVHVDETTWRKKGKMVWIWAVVAKFMCYYRISDRRNKEAAQIALGKDYKGFVTSDRYGAYLYIHESKRQVCWSHLDRQFEEFASAKGHSGFFGQEMMRLTDKMFREWKHVRDGTITRREFYKAAQIEIEAPMIMLIKQGREYGNSRVKAMCGDILRHHLPSLFNFARHDGIEPTNNVAERALRFDVILRKLSFGSWSDSGCEYISRISTVRETCRLQNRSFYEYLNSLIRSIRHGMPLPTLVAV